jgi:hypothetical protein
MDHVRRLFLVVGPTAAFLGLLGACGQDFDAFTVSDGVAVGPDGAALPTGRDDGGAATVPPDGSTTATPDASTKSADAGVDAAPVDCSSKSACYSKRRTCDDACNATESNCVDGCGNNIGCKSKCKADGTTCANACTSTCFTCAGTGCGGGCN